jgi:hypothetical protein
MLGEVDILDFGMDDAVKTTIIQKGKEAVIQFMKQHTPKRRHSIS